ncbi:MAG: hypothetical protein M1831_005871 [Alyxoria varia]|nr:MAG: hypothetical protein M1831_005871 [Alyxoria varia]
MSLASQSVEKAANAPSCVVVACSALKRAYRDVLRGQVPPPSKSSTTPRTCVSEIADADRDISVRFIYLRAPEESITSRVRSRQGHYMKEEMVKSQFLELEEPNHDELIASTEGDCDVLDLQSGDGDEGPARMLNVDEVFEQVERVLRV